MFWPHGQRRRWDSNPRPLSESPVFKTGSLNHSDTSPRLLEQYTIQSYDMSREFFCFFLFPLSQKLTHWLQFEIWHGIQV